MSFWPPGGSGDQNKPYAHQMVRTDSRDQKLDAFLQRTPQSADTRKEKHKDDGKKSNREEEAMETDAPSTSRSEGIHYDTNVIK